MNNIVLSVFKTLTQNRRAGLTVLFFLVLAVHGNIFQNQFVMDDFDFIVDWPLIRDWSNFGRFFISYTPPAGQEGIYSPLKTLFHAVNYHLFGLNPLGYHVASLIIHCCGIYFVHRILSRLTNDAFIAFIGGLIFALHPVQVEAITYMTASIDMIGIVFLFASIDWYLRARGEGGPFDQRSYLISVIFAILAVFTHELAISLPLLILWYEILYRGRNDGILKIIDRVQPYFTAVVIYVLLKFLVLGSITRGPYIAGNFYLTMLVTLKAWAKYVILCLFPAVLTHDHMIAPGISSFDQDDFNRVDILTQSFFGTQELMSLAILGILVYTAVKYRKNDPLIPFGIGFFFIALLPVSNLVPSGVYFGERYLYPGLLGFSLLTGIFIKKLFGHKQALVRSTAALLTVLLVSAYSVRTWIRNRDWNNEIVLFESAVAANPQSALMRTDRGLVYLKYNDPQKALNSFQEAIAIRPDDPVNYFSMAEAYTVLNKEEEAIGALYKVIQLDPEYPEAYYNLAGVYAHMKMPKEARNSLSKALRLFREQGRENEARQYKEAFTFYFREIAPYK